MRIYIKISLAGFCVTRTSLNIGVSFKTIKPVKNWEKTPHFMFGNLLCLSPSGNFKVILLFNVHIWRPDVSIWHWPLYILLEIAIDREIIASLLTFISISFLFAIRKILNTIGKFSVVHAANSTMTWESMLMLLSYHYFNKFLLSSMNIGSHLLSTIGRKKIS